MAEVPVHQEVPAADENPIPNAVNGGGNAPIGGGNAPIGGGNAPNGGGNALIRGGNAPNGEGAGVVGMNLHAINAVNGGAGIDGMLVAAPPFDVERALKEPCADLYSIKARDHGF